LREFPPVAPGRVVAAVAQVVGELALERGLDQPLGQLREQPALAGQLQPAGTGTPGQLGDQLFVDSVQTRRVQISPPVSSSRSTNCSGITSVIRCSP
jgi:hypothetical protein